ncbi:transcription elongation factor [bacterium]|nr:transcription elongation factor [bacterium]
MPEKGTVKKARKAKREGKAPTTQAGEFVREEIHHVREGKHGARSAKQAIAIGLSKARRGGVRLKPPKKGTVSKSTREQAEKDYRAGSRNGRKKPSSKRSRSSRRALKKEGHRTVSKKALSRQAKQAARRRKK